MKLEEARKLAEDVRYHSAHQTPRCEDCVHDEKQRKAVIALTQHCYNHFDEVVKELERVRAEWKAGFSWAESAVYEESRLVLLRAKEVKG